MEPYIHCLLGVHRLNLRWTRSSKSRVGSYKTVVIAFFLNFRRAWKKEIKIRPAIRTKWRDNSSVVLRRSKNLSVKERNKTHVFADNLKRGYRGPSSIMEWTTRTWDTVFKGGASRWTNRATGGRALPHLGGQVALTFTSQPALCLASPRHICITVLQIVSRHFLRLALKEFYKEKQELMEHGASTKPRTTYKP